MGKSWETAACEAPHPAARVFVACCEPALRGARERPAPPRSPPRARRFAMLLLDRADAREATASRARRHIGVSRILRAAGWSTLACTARADFCDTGSAAGVGDYSDLFAPMVLLHDSLQSRCFRQKVLMHSA